MVKIFSIILATVALTSAVTANEDVNAGRKLQVVTMDPFWPDRDLCENSVDANGIPQLGPCDRSRFPVCKDDEQLCYNRKPSRDEFFDDNHQPRFLIQYDRVLCYPNKWGACSSCTPGRYCRSERRCILEERDYPCVEWL
mmetsp:Transcript_39777/g.96039  ORF Transcript_39777/g.96039 Transcript_39777/m.96039 type:complete len:140 (+) Transcript_39777:87-506(+)